MTLPLQMAMVSIKVGDAADGPPIAALIADLEHITHDGAAAHYGRSSGCHYRAWTRETEHGRADFADFLRDCVPDFEKYLREFDEASRPVAIVHWWIA